MKKLIALLLVISLLFSFTACGKKNGSGTPDTNVNGDNNVQNNQQTPNMTVAVPEYKDYGRGTVDFDKLVYSRPNIEALLTSLRAATDIVTKNETSIDEQIAGIVALEESIHLFKTMYVLANIYTNKNSSDEYWQSEYSYISTNAPTVSQATEDLMIACARSVHRETFENDYFGFSLEEYESGGIYTDEVVALMAEEARLKSEYTSISTANVKISYNGVSANMRWEGTVDEVIAKAREYFKNDNTSFERCLLSINMLYEKARQEIEKPLLIDLIKIRRLIADELGYESYSELAYEKQGYDYTPEDMLALLDDIGQYAAPVASNLEQSVFQSYFATNVQPRADKIAVINTLYGVYKDLGGDYEDAYSYMLQHGLYDISSQESNRYNGAFTAYIPGNASPYLFVSTSGFIVDYTSVAHEFGHFLDFYVNNGNDGSLSLSEISSQALELLTVTKLRNNMPSRNYAYLEYYTMFTFLNSILLTQSFYAAFEHLAYSLEYDEITEARLSRLVKEAFSLVFGDDMTIEGDLSYVTVAHAFVSPFYVESYVTAGIVSLDIFFMESTKTGTPGNGFAVYDSLIHRSNTELSFIERLESVGLDSPFENGKVKTIADNIYFRTVGKHYYISSNTDIEAA